MRDNKSNNRRSPFSIMHVALLLLCAVLITSHLTGGLYAAYISESEGSAGARVIYFGDITLTETGDRTSNGDYLIIPGVDINKKPVVDFEGSESATYVFVEIQVSGNWKTDDGKTFYVQRSNLDTTKLITWNVAADWTFLSNSGNSYVYYYKGAALAPNNKIVQSDIIENGILDVSEKISNSDIASNVFANLAINFQATAVQSIGFESAADAWTSVSAQGGRMQ